MQCRVYKMQTSTTCRFGVVDKIENGTVHVVFNNYSACSSCHANGACSMSDVKEKSIIVETSNQFSLGESVIIVENSQQGYKAVFLGYVLPFLITIITLFASYSYFSNESIPALLSLAMAGIYYMILYFFRNRIKRSFSFTIKKTEEIV